MVLTGRTACKLRFSFDDSCRQPVLMLSSSGLARLVPRVLLPLGVLLALALPASPAEARLQTRGVAVDVVFGEPTSKAVADVDAAADLGANTIRSAIQWAGLEPAEKGRYAGWYLDALDAVVARARKRHVKVMLTPVFTPCWASSGAAGLMSWLCSVTSIVPSLTIRPPATPNDYADFMVFLAKRYGDALAALEVWNEPNLPSFWNSATPATDYAALLKATYTAVKRVAPDLPIVAGALAGADVAFLEKLYDAGIAGSYDVLSVHPYNDGRAPEETIPEQFAHATFLQGLRNVRAALRAHGDTHPVWLTEIGWNTSSQRGQLWLDGVTPAQQAAYLTRALRMLEDPSSGIDFPTGAFIYRLRDVGSSLLDPQHNYGLQSLDGTPKPALAAVREVFTRLAAGTTPPAAAAPADTPTDTTTTAPTGTAPAAPVAPVAPAPTVPRGGPAPVVRVGPATPIIAWSAPLSKLGVAGR
jgi:beta-xylosidase